MSTEEIAYREFRANLADVLNRVEYRSETFVVTRRGKPVARILPEENMSTTQTVPPEINTLINDTLADVGAGNTEDDGASIGEIANAIEIHVIPAVMRSVREQVAREAREASAEFDGKEGMRAEAAILRWFAERATA